MTLAEKIYQCRKTVGLSQEELAERLGVSRQAISKWETGASEPELGKLKLLAESFGVTADWLLSAEETAPAAAPASPSSAQSGDWVDRLPHTFGKLVRRYGWLAALYYLVIPGALLTLFSGGQLIRIRQISDRFGTPLQGSMIPFPLKLFLGLGLFLLAAGVVLTLYLRHMNKENK